MLAHGGAAGRTRAAPNLWGVRKDRLSLFDKSHSKFEGETHMHRGVPKACPLTHNRTKALVTLDAEPTA